MSVPCPLEVTFALIAVTTRPAASTVPVPSRATPWRSTGAAVRVSSLYGNVRRDGCSLKLCQFECKSHFCECLRNTLFFVVVVVRSALRC